MSNTSSKGKKELEICMIVAVPTKENELEVKKAKYGVTARDVEENPIVQTGSVKTYTIKETKNGEAIRINNEDNKELKLIDKENYNKLKEQRAKASIKISKTLKKKENEELVVEEIIAGDLTEKPKAKKTTKTTKSTSKKSATVSETGKKGESKSKVAKASEEKPKTTKKATNTKERKTTGKSTKVGANKTSTSKSKTTTKRTTKSKADESR